MTIGIYALKLGGVVVYIGQSNNIESRVQQHIRLLDQNKHRNVYLQRKYNRNKQLGLSLNWVLLEECSLTELDEKERDFIKQNKHIGLANISEGGKRQDSIAGGKASSKLGYYYKACLKGLEVSKAKQTGVYGQSREYKSMLGKLSILSGVQSRNGKKSIETGHFAKICSLGGKASWEKGVMDPSKAGKASTQSSVFKENSAKGRAKALESKAYLKANKASVESGASLTNLKKATASAIEKRRLKYKAILEEAGYEESYKIDKETAIRLKLPFYYKTEVCPLHPELQGRTALYANRCSQCEIDRHKKYKEK